MKNKLIPLIVALGASYGVYGQVGIGTPNPNNSSQLEIVASDRGILIPNVSLTSTVDVATITNGNINSLLVFNISTIADIKPGYYYWYVDRWHRIITSTDLDNTGGNVTYNPITNQFTYIDNDGNVQVINFEEIVQNNETITTFVDNGDGTVTYTNEAGVAVTVNMGQGLQGPAGPAGPQGPAGTVGVEGQPGQSGTPGIPGSGTPGAPGDGVTIVTNDSGTWVYNPTTNTWTNINGPAGPQGPAGTVGVEGQPGQSGTPGIPGSGTPGAPGDGVTIVTNDSGTWVFNPTTNTWTNINGPAGPQGPAGTVGVEGQPGQSGTPGIPGSGTPGAPGDGVTIVTNDSGTWVFNPTTNTWTNINGPAGPQGPAGTVGVEGQPGQSGTPGIPGSGTPGAPGDGVTIVTNDSGTWVFNPTTNTWTNINGPAGPQGPAGTVGVEGQPGQSGTPGIPGSGTPGAPGDGVTIVTNDSGTWVFNPTTNTWTNINGPAGATGPQGPAGTVGVEGQPGQSGTPGIPGSGTPGAPGDGVTIVTNDSGTWVYNPTTNTWTNINGPVGPAGATGPQGPQGLAGADGTDGIDGATGPQGPAGLQGPAGADGQGGVTTAGTGISVTGAGTSGDPYVVATTVTDTDDQQIEVFDFDTATKELTLTLEDGGSGTVDLSVLAATASNGTDIDDTLGDVKLGGPLTEVTTITASVANTLAIAGLQDATATDKIVMADAVTGVLRVKDANASKVVKVTAAYSALANDATILADASGAPFTLTLPTAASSTGRTIVISKVDDTANLLTFSESIKLNEIDTFTGINYNTTIRIQSDGTDWYMID
ncbi:collagen-like protein [Flavobacterium cerinum]|uniref:Collagen-like protein n=1 Tax=Flavobacterium cerinum TaxID=2502784 RepID=A0A444H0U4_9FLAO|nr:collagen-like protein [Flavobacterium cerinum]RWW96754.1 collagen-like protein [Flavobacterium cerinum]